ncbi:MAG: hypothetical protein KA155_08060 [Alphaproteobacteria bacterium]|nr:hypothetical protein [Alphaproteobacteria bacterium]
MSIEKRLDTKLAAQGAEFLVLGHILLEDIECYKAYTNYPDYDLLATSPAGLKNARIQVKSRWATNRAGHFPIDSLDCDFVVHVAFNRGIRKQKRVLDDTKSPIEYYVFPIELIRKALLPSNKINIRNIFEHEKYKDRWDLIKEFLFKGEEK